MTDRDDSAPAALGRPASSPVAGEESGLVSVIVRTVRRAAADIAAAPHEALPWALSVARGLVYPLAVGIPLLLAGLVATDGLVRVAAVLASPFVVTALFAVLATIPPRAPPPRLDGTVRLMSLNVLVVGDAVTDKIAAVRAADADVVGLIEVPAALRLRLDEIADRYPHRHVTSDVVSAFWREPMDMVLLSRHPLEARELGAGAALYRVAAPAPFHVLLVHPPAPTTIRRWRARDAAFAALAGAELPRPLVVMGDFNAVPWDPAVRALMVRHGLHHAGSLWPTFPAKFAATPIDHVLVAGIDARRFWRLRVAGTDHLAVGADLRLR